MNNRNIIAEKKQKLSACRLYAITGEEYSRGRNTVEVARLMLEAGIGILQYREKEKSGLEKYRDCLALRELTAKHGAIFIVNDDVDIALAVRADGVHVGQTDMPPEAVRSLVGEAMIIGLSTHAPRQAREALARGVDYIGVGPLYPTQTKKDVCPAVGLEYLEYVARNIPLPFVAIGGIKRHNLHEVLRCGARCVAMVTEIIGAQDIPARIKEIECLFAQEA